MTLPIHRLEAYSLRYPQEVLVVEATLPPELAPRQGEMILEPELEQVMVFRGFSSSLTRPTAFDPAVPILPDSATLHRVSRYQGPYHPDHPVPLEESIPWPTFRDRLDTLGC